MDFGGFFRCVKTEYLASGATDFVWSDRGSGADRDTSWWKIKNADSQGTSEDLGVFKAAPPNAPGFVIKQGSYKLYGQYVEIRLYIHDSK